MSVVVMVKTPWGRLPLARARVSSAGYGETRCVVAIAITAVIEAESVVLCFSGFVTQQLQSQATLRPLERWFHQLQLILLTASHSDGARDDSPASEEEEDHAMALLKLERVLAQDVACFDLQYASGTRVQDVVTRPFGSGSHSQPSLPEEILSFSSMKRGSVCRVTCVHTNAQHQQPQYAFHSSLFIRDFAAKATQLLIQSRDAHSLVELVRSEPPPRA